jgi:integrase
VLWIFYSFRGQIFRESAHTSDEKVARKLLKARLKQVERPGFVGPKEDKWTLADMKKRIEADYDRKENRSLKTVEYCFKHLEDAFQFHRVIDITTPVVEKYTADRLKAGSARASINRELAYLRHGFKLMLKAGDISAIPAVIELLQGENVREGFLHIPDFEAAAAQVQDDDTRDIIHFLYESAWRSGEAASLEWGKIDLQDWVIRLPRKSSKNKKPRTLVLEADLKDIIVRRLAKRRPDCPYVFHRQGKPIRSFRKAFKGACAAVGLKGILPHDMRRSAIRNLRRAGNDEKECMEISGHETRAIFDRYDVIDENDQRRALQRRQEYKRQQLEEGRKVVPLKRETA